MPRFPIHLFLGLTGILPAQDAPTSGEAIYAEHCASCHGKHGEGVPDEVETLVGEEVVGVGRVAEGLEEEMRGLVFELMEERKAREQERARADAAELLCRQLQEQLDRVSRPI